VGLWLPLCGGVGVGAGGVVCSPRYFGTLRELWRFRDYARPERRPLLWGVVMRGFELAADLAAPWPLRW